MADEDYNESSPEPQVDSPEQRARKRKREQAIERIKNSKDFARRKARKTKGSGEVDDDDLANEIMKEKERPPPGQLANCEICGKRFTVTAYSKAGPEGGLLCPACSKKHTGKDKDAPPKKRNSGINRRQNQSKLMDGFVLIGTRTLLETCIKVCFLNSDEQNISSSLTLSPTESCR